MSKVIIKILNFLDRISWHLLGAIVVWYVFMRTFGEDILTTEQGSYLALFMMPIVACLGIGTTYGMLKSYFKHDKED